MQSLNQGISQVQGGLDALNKQSAGLTGGSAQMKEAVNGLVEEYGKLDSGLNAYMDGVAQVTAGYQQVAGGAKELAKGSSALKSGSTALYSGTANLLNGIVELYDATGTLHDGAGQLDDGVTEMVAGISTLYDGAGELYDGTGELRTETSGMDTEIEDKIDELLDTVTGDDLEITSFVSDKNTNVDSVQFVIKTDSLEIEETEEVVHTNNKKMSIWQKFLNLFGLYDED